MTERMISIPLGIVIERRDVDHPWQDHEWGAVDLILGAGDTEEWLEIGRGDGWVRYHAGTLPLELHRRETEAYRVNLANDPPLIYVVLRTLDDPDDEQEIELFLVTASAFDAQDYMDSGEDIVDGLPMSEDMMAWIQAFIDKHHVEEPFKKRKRRRYDPDDVGFGKMPPNGKRRHGGNGLG